MHLGRWLELNTVWSWDLGAIFICIGGNDLVNEQVTHDEIAKRLMALVQSISVVKKGATIVTISPIPRTRKNDPHFAHRFLTRIDMFNKTMHQVSCNHHHLVHNLFVEERKNEYLYRPRLHLYSGDLVHLNAEGRDLFQQLVGFAFESVNCGNFQWSESVVFRHQRRLMLWAF